MAKWSGKIGFAITKEFIDENEPTAHTGIFKEEVIERAYKGDLLRSSKRYEQVETLNDNITISNIVEIVADQYAFENFFAIRYITWMGSKWKVSNIEVKRPRLVLTIGGIYNEQQ